MKTSIAKRVLPLLIGLSIGGVALAQTTPDATQTVKQTTTRQTTTQTAVPAMHDTTTTTTTTMTFPKPENALGEDAIKNHIAEAGYKEVKGLEFKNGVWEAKARGGNDKWVKIKVGPVTGKVYSEDAPSKLTKSEIKAKLAAQGYENISDVDFDNGLWSADAETTHGKDVDLLVDPDNGDVVARSND
ncbi:MAG TPA: PepSY domain-containing protein [Rhodanobacteraceae bacterium]